MLPLISTLIDDDDDDTIIDADIGHVSQASRTTTTTEKSERQEAEVDTKEEAILLGAIQFSYYY